MKKISAFFVICSMLTPISAYADSDTVKSVLGGIVGSLIVEGVKEATKPQEQEQPQNLQGQNQQETIRWEDDRNNMPARAIPRPYVDTRIQEVQILLQRTGHYQGKVDGIDGPGTQNAIRSWEVEFDQVIDGTISDPERALLRETAEEGFDENHLGSVALTEAEEAEIEADLQYNEHKAGQARLFLEDAESFMKNYKGDVDLGSITDDLKILRMVSKGRWNDSMEAPYQRLQTFFSGLAGFDAYRESEAAERELQADARKAVHAKEIADMVEFSGDFLKANITSEGALAFNEEVKTFDLAELSSMTEPELSALQKKLEKQMHVARLHGEYTRWRALKYPKPQPDYATKMRNLKQEMEGAKAPDSFWTWFMGNAQTIPPLCDSPETKGNIRDIYVENPGISAVPYDVENITEILHDPKLNVRKCRGVALTNTGKHAIQYTYSPAGSSAYSGYILDTMIDTLTLENRMRLNQFLDINDVRGWDLLFD